jgi:hypothetical protein
MTNLAVKSVQVVRHIPRVIYLADEIGYGCPRWGPVGDDPDKKSPLLAKRGG